jgi:tetratricopeptide (TPR) repeat protein
LIGSKQVTDKPTFDEYLDLGLALHSRGRIKDGADHFTRALEIHPDDPEALCLLGAAQISLGEQADGLARLRRAVAIEPGEPRFQIQLALALDASGMAAEALPHIHACARYFSNNIDFVELRVRSALAAGAHDEALEHATALTAGKSANAHHFRLLSKAKFEQQDVLGAKLAYQSAMGLDTTASREDLVAMARFELMLNAPNEARYWIDQCLEQNPDYIPALETKARIAINTGEGDVARQFAQTILSKDPGNIPAISIALELDLGSDDTLAESAKALSLNTSAPPRERKALWFALAQYYDKTQNYIDAFQAASTANRLSFEVARDSGQLHDLDRSARQRELTRQIFSAAFIRQAHRALEHLESKQPRPIFVVAPPRSGTSLTEKLLASAPDAAGIGERGATLKMYRDAVKVADRAGVEASRAHILRSLAQIAVAERGAWSKVAPGKAVVIDKTPSHLDACGWLAALFPDAIFVGVSRDLRDVGVSCFFQDLPEEYGYSTNFERIAGALKQDALLADHWRALPLKWVDFSYDQFVQDPELNACALIKACQLTWSEEILSENQQSDLNGFSALSARGDVIKSRSGRWVRYQSYIGPLTDTFGIESVARSPAR